MDAALLLLQAVLLLTALVLILMWVDAGTRGWRRIAAHFTAPPDARNMPTQRQDGSVGRTGLIQLRGLLRAGVSDAGLYITPPRPMRLTHRPLLIPWDQITVREEQRLLGSPLLTLSIGRIHVGFVTLRGGLAGQVLERVAPA